MSALRCAAVSCAAVSVALSAHAQQAPPADTAPSAPTEPTPQAPAPATPAPPSEAGSEEEQAPEDKRGTIVVLFFTAEGLPLPAGSIVRLEDGTSATTTDDGTARLQTSSGPHVIELVTQDNSGAEQRVRVAEVVVLAGQSVQVLVNLDGSGGIASADIEGGGAPVPEAEVGAAPVEEEVVIEYGQISGTVRSSETGSVVEGARVLVRGVEDEVVTDATGHFSIKAPVGTQSVSVLHVKYSLQTVNDIVVEKDAATEVVVELTPTATQLDDFVVTAPYIKGGVASVLAQRRKSTAVQDGLGVEEISKSPDGSASSATRRIVGASIVGGSYLLVRGLGGRYSNVRLNGVPMPSTDPDLPGFQLDLFPTSLLSSLTISKTFSPDIPGDFAGGSLNVETRSFPEEFVFKLQVSATVDNRTTGQGVLDYNGGSTDWLGYDDGTRAMPDGVPAERIRGRTRANPDVGLSPEEVDEIAASFPNHWKRTESTGLPTAGFGLSLGDTIKTSHGDIGYFFTLGYKNRTHRELATIQTVGITGAGEDVTVTPRDTMKQETGTREALIGTLGTVSYAPVEEHRFSVVSMLTQTSSDSTRFLSGYSDAEGTTLQRTFYTFVERQLLFNQLMGEHRKLADVLDVKWQANIANVFRDQPDSRNVTYREGANGFTESGIAGSGEHLYSTLEQQDLGAGIDTTLTVFADAAVKSGYMGRTTDRSFRARRFTPTDLSQRQLPPEELFAPDSVGETWTIQEATIPTDGYKAEQDLHAAYLMFDTPLPASLRAMAGVRMERFHQAIRAVEPYALAEDEEALVPDEMNSNDRLDLDYLPAASLSLALSDQTSVRLAYGGTVARPQLRELSPFVNQDYIRRRIVTGNTNLVRTFIHNFDARWEHFPSPTEVFAVSLFYKMFEHPIEPVVTNSAGDISFANIKGANNFGAEFEARIRLDVLSDLLDDYILMANLALIQSEVELTAEQKGTSTNDKRPLAGQSPYVANLGLGYEPEDGDFSTYVYYNVFGRRIQDVGRTGAPDVYEEPFHSLDWTGFYTPTEHWAFGLSVQNLLYQGQRVRQGAADYQTTEPNISVGASAAWSY